MVLNERAVGLVVPVIDPSDPSHSDLCYQGFVQPRDDGYKFDISDAKNGVAFGCPSLSSRVVNSVLGRYNYNGLSSGGRWEIETYRPPRRRCRRADRKRDDEDIHRGWAPSAVLFNSERRWAPALAVLEERPRENADRKGEGPYVHTSVRPSVSLPTFFALLSIPLKRILTGDGCGQASGVWR
eukprot:1150075-Rhodomonas_salina.3